MSSAQVLALIEYALDERGGARRKEVAVGGALRQWVSLRPRAQPISPAMSSNRTSVTGSVPVIIP